MARIKLTLTGSRNLSAFLDMLGWSEGTSTRLDSDDGYNVMVGGDLFTSYADHPRQRVWLPRYKIHSTAAGRYQLLERYWDSYRKILNLKDGFTPKNQDRVAIKQILEQRALDDINAGRIIMAIEKCRNIWASLPGAGYGQHEHVADDLLVQYQKFGGEVALC